MMYNEYAPEPELDETNMPLLASQGREEGWPEAGNRLDAGFITWDSTPPAGVTRCLHKFSMLEVFETAFDFIDMARNGQDSLIRAAPEIIIGRVMRGMICVMPYVRREMLLMQVAEAEDLLRLEPPTPGSWHLATWRGHKIYFDPMIEPDRFVVQDEMYRVCGLVLNHPIAFGRTRTPDEIEVRNPEIAEGEET